MLLSLIFPLLLFVLVLFLFRVERRMFPPEQETWLESAEADGTSSVVTTSTAQAAPPGDVAAAGAESTGFSMDTASVDVSTVGDAAVTGAPEGGAAVTGVSSDDVSAAGVGGVGARPSRNAPGLSRYLRRRDRHYSNLGPPTGEEQRDHGLRPVGQPAEAGDSRAAHGASRRRDRGRDRRSRRGDRSTRRSGPGSRAA